MMNWDDESGFQPHFFSSADGLRLYARDYGPRISDGLPIICLPGLTRNSRDFHQLALLLSQDVSDPRRVMTLDSRGRGQSDWDPDRSHYTVITEANDVVAACAAFNIDRAIFIGTSRGGLVLHILAHLAPDLIAACIFNDIGPVIESAGLAEIKAYLNRKSDIQSWDDAVSTLKRNHGHAFPVLSEDDWYDMAHAIYRQIDGKFVADFDPAIAEILAALNTDVQMPTLWPQFEALTARPLLVIRGENSTLLSSATVEAMKARHPMLQSLSASGQGHAPLLHIDNIPSEIKRFLQTI